MIQTKKNDGFVLNTNHHVHFSSLLYAAGCCIGNGTGFSDDEWKITNLRLIQEFVGGDCDLPGGIWAQGFLIWRAKAKQSYFSIIFNYYCLPRSTNRGWQTPAIFSVSLSFQQSLIPSSSCAGVLEGNEMNLVFVKLLVKFWEMLRGVKWNFDQRKFEQWNSRLCTKNRGRRICDTGARQHEKIDFWEVCFNSFCYTHVQHVNNN